MCCEGTRYLRVPSFNESGMIVISRTEVQIGNLPFQIMTEEGILVYRM